MRINFYVVGDEARRWRLLRGTAEIRSFDQREQALRAAEGFARASACRGERAAVTIREPDGSGERREFAPDPFRLLGQQ